MENQAAEIAAQAGSAEVDSDAQNALSDGSAPSAAEAGAASDQPEKGKSPDKQRDAVNERFDKLTRDLYELRSERDRDRYEIQSRDERIKALEAELGKAKPSQVAPDAAPTLEQFGYDEAKYSAAMIEYAMKTTGGKLREEIIGEITKKEQEREQQARFGSWNQRQKAFADSNPDYVEKVLNARSLPISHELQQEIMQLELGPQVALHLVENREKAEALMRLPLSAQLRELGRIEASIEAKKAAPKPPVSQAPPPPPKVDATTTPTSIKVDSADSDALSDAEWMRRRNAQLSARQRNAKN